MTYLRPVFVVLGLLLATTASAQRMPTVAEFYFDDDARVAAPIVAIAGEGDEVHGRLLQLIERNARNADQARAQLARALMRSGREETGRAMYTQLLDALPARAPMRSSVHWNYGWDLYRAGKPDDALAQWVLATEGRLLKPSWVPPTLALGLWRADRRDEAVQWYAAAVRTEPQAWNDPARFPQLLPDWTDAERATLTEVFTAWRANPPTWP